MRTPWGLADVINPYAEGLAFVSTASHGGFYIEGEYRKRIPDWITEHNWLGSTVWFEEDCDAWLVVWLIPERFEPRKVVEAGEMIRLTRDDGESLLARLTEYRAQFAHDSEGRCLAPTIFGCPEGPH